MDNIDITFDFSNIPDNDVLAKMIEECDQQTDQLAMKSSALQTQMIKNDQEMQADARTFFNKFKEFKMKELTANSGGARKGAAHYDGKEATEEEVLAELAKGENHIGGISKKLGANAGKTLKSLLAANKVVRGSGTANGTIYKLA